jgi:membrane protein DedA with SNARE-associated domain
MQHFISSYGYLAIILLMVAESACIPVPSELTMPLGGAIAAGAVAGVHLNLALVIAAGVAGNIIGSYLAWAVGRYGGEAVTRRWSHFLGGRSGLERAQRWFDRYGGRAVFFGRLLPVVRTFISLPAGYARMRPVRFGVYTAAGSLPWAGRVRGRGQLAARPAPGQHPVLCDRRADRRARDRRDRRGHRAAAEAAPGDPPGAGGRIRVRGAKGTTPDGLTRHQILQNGSLMPVGAALFCCG